MDCGVRTDDTDDPKVDIGRGIVTVPATLERPLSSAVPELLLSE